MIERSKEPLTSWLLRSWFMYGAYPQRDKGQIAVKRSYEYQLFRYSIDTVSALWGYTPGGQPVQAPCTLLKQIFEYLTITDRMELAVTSQNNQDELEIDQARKNRQVEYELQKAVTITRAAVAFLVAKELCRLRCTDMTIHYKVYNFRELFNTNLPRSSQENIARLRSHFGPSHFSEL